jgi:hypothetical protein
LQCTIGVALISDGRLKRAVAAYDGATSLAQRLHPLRRRAVLATALAELALAKRLLPDVVTDEATEPIRSLLGSAIERAEREAEERESALTEEAALTTRRRPDRSPGDDGHVTDGP